jgi:hypothetical protein
MKLFEMPIRGMFKDATVIERYEQYLEENDKNTMLVTSEGREEKMSEDSSVSGQVRLSVEESVEEPSNLVAQLREKWGLNYVSSLQSL